MKKITFFSISGIALITALLTSCAGGITTTPNLKTETDSLSYAMGVNLYETGLNQYLMRSGFVSDTASLKKFLEYQIDQEKDEAKKAQLTKEIGAKIDSAKRANDKNIAEFMRGFQEGLKAADAQGAYMEGLSIGRQISSHMLPSVKTQLYGEKADSIHINKDALISGVAISVLNKKQPMENASSYVENKIAEAQMKQQEQERLALESIKTENEAKAKVFFEENAKKDGVKTLPNGLQYKILTKGTGAKPKLTDVVVAHYKGTLLDGTVFDSSYERGEPASFRVNEVIKGWTEALQLMPVGSKWILYIPQDLGYGANAAGSIPPYSPLVFEVELISIQ